LHSGRKFLRIAFVNETKWPVTVPYSSRVVTARIDVHNIPAAVVPESARRAPPTPLINGLHWRKGYDFVISPDTAEIVSLLGSEREVRPGSGGCVFGFESSEHRPTEIERQPPVEAGYRWIRGVARHRSADGAECTIL